MSAVCYRRSSKTHVDTRDATSQKLTNFSPPLFLSCLREEAGG